MTGSERSLILDRRRLLQGAVLGAAGVVFPRADALGAVGAAAEEVDAFEGTIVAVSASRGIIEIDRGNTGRLERLRATPASSFWRGGDTGIAAFLEGDDVLVRTVGERLDSAWANLGVIRGVVAGPTSAGQEITRDHGRSPIEMLLNGATRFDDAYTGEAVRPNALPIGTAIDATGLLVDGALLASAVTYVLPGAKPKSKASPGPDKVTGPSPLVTYTYFGIASIYDCATGTGRCGTCNTGNASQLAWPALDACNCCTSSCCDCSIGCKNQVRTSCGKAVSVTDPCNGRSRGCTIVDCGPCQNPNCHTCIVVCSHTSSNCGITRTGTIVDLTRPTFTTFYNPTTRTSFPASATITFQP
jgi:hypothetical protein